MAKRAARQHWHTWGRDSLSEPWTYHMTLDCRDDAVVECREGRSYFKFMAMRRGESRRMEDVNARVPPSGVRR